MGIFIFEEFPYFPADWSLGNLSSESGNMSIAYYFVAYCVVFWSQTWELLSLIIVIQILFLSCFRFTVNVHRNTSGIFPNNFKGHWNIKFLKIITEYLFWYLSLWWQNGSQTTMKIYLKIILFLKLLRLECIIFRYHPPDPLLERQLILNHHYHHHHHLLTLSCMHLSRTSVL